MTGAPKPAPTQPIAVFFPNPAMLLEVLTLWSYFTLLSLISAYLLIRQHSPNLAACPVCRKSNNLQCFQL
jgi:hypothetical protein